jgi:DNA-3-methyladenine glycosylase I
VRSRRAEIVDVAKKEVVRCAWSEGVDDAYTRYHDEEWGVPVRDDRVHFEFLLLESAQAGLSWWTILRKRDGYRRAFADFDAAKVARFTPRTVEKLMQDASIVRNRQKIEAAIANARGFLAIQQEFGRRQADRQSLAQAKGRAADQQGIRRAQ